MKIALVVPFEESVPPKRYGGIELVVANLADELVDLGHSVTVFGTEDSTVSARLSPIFKRPIRSTPQASTEPTREAFTFAGISEVLKRLQIEPFDIVHNHIGWRFLLFSQHVMQPLLTTLHLSLENQLEQMFYQLHKTQPIVSITDAQRQPNRGLNYIRTIHNGIKVDHFTTSSPPLTHQDYLAFLGSIVPHKGPDIAIKVAKKCGRRLIIGAKVDPLQVEYFEKEIKPHIDGEQIIWLGEVDHHQKNKLLRESAALLMPIQWNEPFGLVMVEALASGTPVITFKKGSTPEVIKNGITGWICDDIDEMCAKVDEIGSLDRQACRKDAEERFTAKRMAEEYLEVYESLVDLHDKSSL